MAREEKPSVQPRPIWTRLYIDIDTPLSDALNDRARELGIAKKTLLHNIIKEYFSGKGKAK